MEATGHREGGGRRAYPTPRHAQQASVGLPEPGSGQGHLYPLPRRHRDRGLSASDFPAFYLSRRPPRWDQEAFPTPPHPAPTPSLFYRLECPEPSFSWPALPPRRHLPVLASAHAVSTPRPGLGLAEAGWASFPALLRLLAQRTRYHKRLFTICLPTAPCSALKVCVLFLPSTQSRPGHTWPWAPLPSWSKARSTHPASCQLALVRGPVTVGEGVGLSKGPGPDWEGSAQSSSGLRSRGLSILVSTTIKATYYLKTR